MLKSIVPFIKINCVMITRIAFNQGKYLTPSATNIRYYAAPKRFYRKTSILNSDGKYEITLDQRKLKTPRGNQFLVNSEPLALAVAAEWDAQKDKIQQSSMHLDSDQLEVLNTELPAALKSIAIFRTALCSTAIDNPNKLTKYDLVQQIISFLVTDTVLFQSSEADELYDLQVEKWQPVLEWFCKRFDVKIEPARDISGPLVSQETKAAITRHLLSYNFWAVHGFIFGVEAVKSVILTLCCVERHISVEKAVLLSRLEEEFQSGYWGRVEWAHDLNQQETQARLAAAVLFIHLNSSSTFVQSKKQVSSA